MPLAQKQKENIAKYLFDISKLSFGGIVVGKIIAREELLSWVFIIGIAFSVATFILAVVIDKGGKAND
ncbi:MAG: DUF6722 family protein [Nitrospirota bacterium]